MTTDAIPSTRISFGEKAGAYFRLGKLRVYHHFYAWLLAVLLLAHESVSRPGTAVALGLVLIGMYAMKIATCAADDVVGFRDGSDAQNYAAGGHLPKSNKPLLSGMLSEKEAIGFGIVTGLIAFGSGLALLIPLGGDVPILFLAGWFLVVAIAVQYSWLFQFSYRPGGLEFVIFLVNTAEVLGPVWLIARHWSTDSLLIGLLIGVCMLLVVTYANFGDRVGDLAAGRRTLAAVVPSTIYRALIGVLSVLSLALLVAPFVVGSLNPWLLVCVVPAIVLRALQIRAGLIKDETQRAVVLGFRSIDAVGLGLALALVLS
ncbi:1,4-dihydroxy-2-naphthoate octaprenyltransferase [Nocardia transvalensis]|uniref:1,4-dihydroxy-2-naphthoate octaprenyltransferase n=1 Tax=Nocardia transvalensis TaxID=37333 RepID=A0A7W9PA41_9NOCA|nr:UbiA family prenyltransferase [Nocardia transvalensis]MBB5912160.1 1,4-dihydroxy-2-naphthoate octaprenyltransferase [Nocardia transvalensis]